MKQTVQTKDSRWADHCDKCGALVIDELGKYDEYTVTEFSSNGIKVHLYCPACIKKYGIITDANQTPAEVKNG